MSTFSDTNSIAHSTTPTRFTLLSTLSTTSTSTHTPLLRKNPLYSSLGSTSYPAAHQINAKSTQFPSFPQHSIQSPSHTAPSSVQPTYQRGLPTPDQIARKRAQLQKVEQSRLSAAISSPSASPPSTPTSSQDSFRDSTQSPSTVSLSPTSTLHTVPTDSLSSSSTTRITHPVYDTEKDLQDIFYAFKTITLRSVSDQFVPPFSTYRRKLASLVIKHGVRFVHVLKADPHYREILSTIPQNSLLHSICTGSTPISTQKSIMVSKYADITWEDLLALQPNCWLGMEIVNGFMALLQARRAAWVEYLNQLHTPTLNQSQRNQPISTQFKESSADTSSLFPKVPKHMHEFVFPSFHALPSQFSSIFLNKQTDTLHYLYSTIQRWSLRANLILNNLDYILVPCHMHGNHWTLLCADLKNREICYFDSFQQDDEDRCQLLASYLHDEWLTYGGWNGYTPQEEVDHYMQLQKRFPTILPQTHPLSSSKQTTFNPLTLSFSNVNIEHNCLGRGIGETRSTSQPFNSHNTMAHMTTPQKPSTSHFTSPTFSTHPALQSHFSHFSQLSQAAQLAESSTSPRDGNTVEPKSGQWDLRYKPFKRCLMKSLPLQTNTFDCGVFVCAFANIITLGGQIKGTPVGVKEKYDRKIDALSNLSDAGNDPSRTRDVHIYAELVAQAEVSTNILSLKQQQYQFFQQHRNSLQRSNVDHSMNMDDEDVDPATDNVDRSMTSNQRQYEMQYAAQLAKNRQIQSHNAQTGMNATNSNPNAEQFNISEEFAKSCKKRVFWFEQKDLADFRKRMVLAFLDQKWCSPQEEEMVKNARFE